MDKLYGSWNNLNSEPNKLRSFCKTPRSWITSYVAEIVPRQYFKIVLTVPKPSILNPKLFSDLTHFSSEIRVKHFTSRLKFHSHEDFCVLIVFKVKLTKLS